MINKSREEAGQFYSHNKLTSHDSLNASKLGYHVAHSMDLYDEVRENFLLENFKNPHLFAGLGYKMYLSFLTRAFVVTKIIL